MRFLPEGWRRAFRIWRRTPAAEVDAELRFHLDERVSDLVAGGIRPDSAKAQALSELGDLQAVRAGLVAIDERMAGKRDRAERWEWVGQDMRYVVRSLRRSPGFVMMVSLTLALGLGANAAVFSVLDRLFLQAPPGIIHPDQVRRLHRVYRVDAHGGTTPGQLTRPGGDFSLFSYSELGNIVANAPPHTLLGEFMSENLPVSAGSEAADGVICFVAGDYFAVLGTHPAIGRFFAPEEMQIDVPTPVAVISGRLWRSRFQGRPDVVGRSIEVNRHHYTVIGVVASDFHGATNNAADVWLPISEMHWIAGMRGDRWSRGTFWLQVLTVARTPASVAAIERAATLAFRQDGISHDTNVVAQLDPLIQAMEPGTNSQEVAIVTRLAGVSLIILLIACANVTNLILARSMRRRREIAVRLALGIRRRRLVALLLAESVAVAVIGGGIAVGVALPLAGWLRQALMPETHWVDPAMNLPVLLLMLMLTLVSGVAAGLVPALQASRPDVAAVLKNGARGQTVRSSRLRSALLIAQAALSVLLLAGAGLFLRSLHSIETEDIGYDVDRVAFATLIVDPDHPERRDAIEARLPELAMQISQIPGVERVGLAINKPMRESWAANVYLPNRDSLLTGVSFVSPEYLGTIGVHLTQGRGLTANDRAGNVSAVLVNETMAHKIWPGRAAIGQCIIQMSPGNPCSRVVGVVADAREMAINEAPTMRFYAPLADTGKRLRARVIAFRAASGQTPAIADRVRRTLKAQFDGQAVPSVQVMRDNLTQELRPWRVGAALFSAAGILALLVAIVGIYSTISYTFSQRTHEIGVRVALGARAANVVRLVVGEGVRVVLVGVVIGVLLALAAGRLVESMLYKTSPRDPAVLLVVSLSLLLVAVGACLVPAWRALGVDPATALRAE